MQICLPVQTKFVRGHFNFATNDFILSVDKPNYHCLNSFCLVSVPGLRTGSFCGRSASLQIYSHAENVSVCMPHDGHVTERCI